MQDLLPNLNQQQQQAVKHGQGPLLILAGAGSGKTRVLTHRIAYLLHQGIAPDEILAITFTNKAATEMKERVKCIVGTVVTDGIWLGTFHAICGRILRSEIVKAGYRSNFVIYDAADQLRLVRSTIKGLNMDEKMYNPRLMQALISRSKNELINPDQIQRYWLQNHDTDYSGYFLERLETVYAAYQQQLKENNALDFDDLLRLAVEIFQTYPDVLATWQRKFNHVLVDEYQDTNRVQYLLVRLLAEKHGNIFVVGDDSQSIYGFRGADIRNILEFEQDFPSARVIKLEQNYRSTQMILEAANSLVAHNRVQKRKRLWTSNDKGDRLRLFEAENGKEEAWFVVRELEHLLGGGYDLKDCAILYRTNAQSRLLEEAMLTNEIPYQMVGGVRFYERMEIKDTLAYLRLLENPYDALSLQRVINTPRRGAGPRTQERVMAYAKMQVIDYITACTKAESIAGIQHKTAKNLVQFGSTIKELHNLMEDMPLLELVNCIWTRTGYQSQLMAEDTIEAEKRQENLNEFANLVAEYVRSNEDKSLSAFLTRVSLFTDQDSYNAETKAVTLMTLHSAKGLEFPVVFLVGFEEGLFPHQRSLDSIDGLEEERRLCYVGLTRAKRRLYLSYARSRQLFGMRQYCSPSRFLSEIPAEFILPVFSPGQQDGPTRKSNLAAKKEKRVISFSTNEVSSSGQSINTTPDWILGDRLEHPQFGVGVVVSTRGTRSDGTVIVAFPTVGLKTLALQYAPIKKI
jgi:DNA helicase-2/ATP-dependent DNA helicase PcrA